MPCADTSRTLSLSVLYYNTKRQKRQAKSKKTSEKTALRSKYGVHAPPGTLKLGCKPIYIRYIRMYTVLHSIKVKRFTKDIKRYTPKSFYDWSQFLGNCNKIEPLNRKNITETVEISAKISNFILQK